uniref:SH3 domain-containing protein n=1 Tax=Strombidinopsis acuminata TaxID=141414 RepID=A0A7S3W5X0_9SPIT|mmetsp:Transcript_13493/g.34747  ORF Transcript_13493/g.34747 Transcript_13493/m.34747 type:complete len:588 (-) Transcript_13493:137-1900(-)
MMTAVDENGMATPARHYPIADAKLAEVLYDYVPDSEFAAQQLTLTKGDTVWVLEQHPSGWWGGHKDGNVHTGWFPEAIVKLTGGDEAPDDSINEGSNWATRCSPSSPAPADMALRTSDHRAVASPQVGGRRRGSDGQRQNERTPQDHVTAELMEANQTLQKELNAQLQRYAEATDTMASAEAKIAQLKQEQALFRRQMEAEREKERQAYDRERHEFEAQRQSWAQDRQKLQCLAHELDEQKRSQEGEVKRLQDELKRKEGEVLQQMSHLRTLEAARERSEAVASALDRARSEDASHHLTSSTHSARDYSRGASTGVSRRLFTTGTMPEARAGIADGIRTPPVGAPTAVIQQVTAVPTSSSMPTPMPTATAMATMTSSSVAPLSARGGNLPRPSPRTAAAAAGAGNLQWMHNTAQPANGPPPSPYHSHRPFTTAASRDASAESAAHQAAVRGLVEAFERRSNSQGAPPVRVTADASPSRQLIYTTGARRAPTAGSSSRAASREMPLRREYLGGDETPVGGLSNTGEDNSMAINFGMSPLPRHNTTTHYAMAPTSRGASAISSSPSAKTSVSVQDRIRRFNAQQNYGTR